MIEIDPAQMSAFADAMFRHADQGGWVSLRAFRDDVDGKLVRIEAVQLNGQLGVIASAAGTVARDAARYRYPTVFCPPIATFDNKDKADERSLANGLALTVELDADAERARKRLEFLIGQATVVVASGGIWDDPETGEPQPKLHVHWRLKEPTRTPEAHARLKRLRGMATALVGGDASNKPIVHPIRWPGSVHRKGEPTLCEILAINPDAEIDLQAALGALLDIQPEFRKASLAASPALVAGRSATRAREDGQPAAAGKTKHREGEDRETPELVRALLTGEDYHRALVALSMRYLAGGMAPKQVVLTLQGLMEAIPPERRDGPTPGRWEARLNDIGRMVREGQTKLDQAQPFVVIDHEDRANAPSSQPTSGAALDAKGTAWMWHPYLPANQITLIGGRGGSCKGLISASLVASITKPQAWPDDTPAESGNVLWCETEDPLAEVVVPRLIAAGADRSRLWFANRECFARLDLRVYILANGIRLIVLSPCVSFLALTDINSELGVRAVLERLQTAIEGTGCAVLGICHLNKKPDLAAIERLLGSVAFSNFVRCVLLVAPENVEDRRFRLVHAKHNLSWKGDDLLFTPKHVGEDPRDQFVKLEWSRPNANVDAEALFDRKKTARDSGSPPRAVTAGDWLATYLETFGESLRADIITDAEKAGFSEAAIRKAHERNPRMKSRQDGWQGPYMWSIA